MELAARIGTMARRGLDGLKIVNPKMDVIDSTTVVSAFREYLQANEMYVLLDPGGALPDNALISFETDDSSTIKSQGVRYRGGVYNIFPGWAGASYDCVVKADWRYVAFSKLGGGITADA